MFGNKYFISRENVSVISSQSELTMNHSVGINYELLISKLNKMITLVGLIYLFTASCTIVASTSIFFRPLEKNFTHLDGNWTMLIYSIIVLYFAAQIFIHLKQKTVPKCQLEHYANSSINSGLGLATILIFFQLILDFIMGSYYIAKFQSDFCKQFFIQLLWIVINNLNYSSSSRFKCNIRNYISNTNSVQLFLFVSDR